MMGKQVDAFLVRRRLLRFSLASLLLVVLAAAIYFDWVANKQQLERAGWRKMSGTWELTSATWDEQSHDDFSFTLDFEDATVRRNDELLDVKVRCDVEPWQMDVKRQDGSWMKCIFKIDEDRMVIVCGWDNARPASFDDRFDGKVVIRLKRAELSALR